VDNSWEQAADGLSYTGLKSQRARRDAMLPRLFRPLDDSGPERGRSPTQGNVDAEWSGSSPAAPDDRRAIPAIPGKPAPTIERWELVKGNFRNDDPVDDFAPSGSRTI
jgi:hypothetical protein